MPEEQALERFDTLGQLAATFAARGQRTAIRTFERDSAGELSYAELATRIGQATTVLQARGVGPGDRVAIFAPNSAAWVIAYFGIIGTGAAAVPIDHQSSAEGAQAAIAFARPRFVLTDRARAAALQGVQPSSIIELDAPGPTGWQAACAAAQPGAPQPTGGDALASLLFTSGTTGTPKAVPLTHGNLAANTRELLAAHLIGADDRVLLPLPLHHTYPFTVGLLGALACGATVVLPAGISGPEISRAATTANATALLAVPRLCAALWDSVVAGVHARGRTAETLFRFLLATSVAVRRVTGLHLGRWLFGAVHAQLGRHLRLIGCGGAPLPADMAWNLEGLGWSVLTGYGLTETSPVLTFNSPDHSRIGSVGRALPGVELRIAPAESGDGEIQARGPSVFSGYWQNTAASAAAFTSDGWFRTGDLGHVDADGYLFVVGRNKELIVLPDGKKLFPEPLEKRYAASPLLHEIAIFEHNGILAALVVPDEATVVQRGALREAALLREELEDIAATLAPYQRIGAYRVTRQPLPRTQLGKLKRHLLPQLFEAAGDQAKQPAASAMSAEDRNLLDQERAAATWRWLRERHPDRELTLDTSPQLDLQIDSLEWVTLTLEIERRFGVAIDSAALSRILTLRDLLREVESAATATTATPAAHTEVAAVEPPGLMLGALGDAILLLARFLMRTMWRLESNDIADLPDEPLLITPNHASYLDPVAVAAALPWRRLRRTYWAGWVGVMHSTWLRRLLARATRVFPVDPDRDLAAAVRTAESLLRRGYSVVWFPEGRRSPTGKLTSFQPGVGVLLRLGIAAALPTAIRGTFDAWPKHRKRPKLSAVSVTFGAPLRFFPAEYPDTERVRADLERAVRELLDGRST